MRIKETIETLSLFIKEGKFDYIGLSECRADTLRRANAVRLLLCASITCGSHVCAGNRRCTPLLRWRSKSSGGPTGKKRQKVNRSSLPAILSLECNKPTFFLPYSFSYRYGQGVRSCGRRPFSSWSRPPHRVGQIPRRSRPRRYPSYVRPFLR